MRHTSFSFFAGSLNIEFIRIPHRVLSCALRTEACGNAAVLITEHRAAGKGSTDMDRDHGDINMVASRTQWSLKTRGSEVASWEVAESKALE